MVGNRGVWVRRGAMADLQRDGMPITGTLKAYTFDPLFALREVSCSI
jgi:hypothetical protein